MNCAACGHSNPPAARFCGECGQSLSDYESARQPPTGGGAAAVIGGAPPRLDSVSPAKPAPATRADTVGLLERARNILLTPRQEWPRIAPEPTPASSLYVGYVLPLLAFAAAVSFVHTSIIGVSLPFGGSIRIPALTGLLQASMGFGMGIVGVYIVGLIINVLAPTFSGQRAPGQALKTAAYSLTPALLGSIFALLPAGSTLLTLLAGCYGIYVLYLGLPLLMHASREKAVGYTAAVVICTILVGILLSLLLGATGVLSHTASRFGGPAGASGAALAQQHGAAALGNAIGGMLGTDAQGKAQLGSALNQLASAARQPDPSAANESSTAIPAGQGAAAASGGLANDSAASPLSAVSGLATALGGALGGAHRVEPVDAPQLAAFLPASLAGLHRAHAQASNQQALGVKGSSASAEYEGPNQAHVEVTISDASGVSGLMDLARALPQTTSASSDTGYEKDIAVGGRPTHEKYDSASQHGELSLMLVKRFEVDVTGDHVDMNTLERSLDGIDLARLEQLQDAGAHAR